MSMSHVTMSVTGRVIVVIDPQDHASRYQTTDLQGAHQGAYVWHPNLVWQPPIKEP